MNRLYWVCSQTNSLGLVFPKISSMHFGFLKDSVILSWVHNFFWATGFKFIPSSHSSKSHWGTHRGYKKTCNCKSPEMPLASWFPWPALLAFIISGFISILLLQVNILLNTKQRFPPEQPRLGCLASLERRWEKASDSLPEETEAYGRSALV